MPESDKTHGAGAATATAPAKPKTSSKRKPDKRTQPRKLPPYNVVLLDDDDHSYEYVIEMLKALFGHPEEKGFRLAEEVDRTGRVIVLTTHKEKAEFKRDQIHAYGRDPRIARSKGAMSAIVEPAEEC